MKSLLKMMKNAFYFILEVTFDLKFLSWLFGHVTAKFLKSQPAISFIIFWDFSIFYKVFLSPQVKRWAIITNKHGIYEMPHK